MSIITMFADNKPTFMYYKMFDCFMCSICGEWPSRETRLQHPCYVAWQETQPVMKKFPPTWPYPDLRTTRGTYQTL